MNNFYVLIYLTRELKARYTPFIFRRSLSPNKNIWEAEISVHEKKYRLVFSSHPSDTALFTDRFRPMKKKNVTSFFRSAEGQIVNDVQLADNDRVISFSLTDEMQLVFRLFGNHPNIFLVRNGMIEESFKSPQKYIGNVLEEPRKSSHMKPLDDSMNAKQAILATDSAFPRHLIQPVIKHYGLLEKSPEQIREQTLRLRYAMLNHAEFRVLEDGNICLIPFDMLPLPNLQVFDTAEEAIRYAYYKTSGERRLTAKKSQIEPALEKAGNKLNRSIKQLKNSGKALERAEKYEQYGHLLMARAHEEAPPGTSKVTVKNFYDENSPVDIAIQPDKTMAENASYYYRKSAAAIKSAEESERRLLKSEKALKDVLRLERSFQNIQRVYEFDDWMKANEKSMKELGILSSGGSQPSLPFRKIEVDSYEIWVGRNARSNDKLTSMAHKEDIWLHARGVSGSHVVIRMNNNKEFPPRMVILKAAAIAAWNSKARGSAMVPVIVTKKKYVTKPKGAPAGAVRVQKERVEMVEPKAYKSEIS